MTNNIPNGVLSKVRAFRSGDSERDSQFQAVFANCFSNTLDTTMSRMPDGTTFILTGDIPAMWLRDASSQIRPYIGLAADDPEFADSLVGVVKRQFFYILIDAYANAFNSSPSGACHAKDQTDTNPWVWERKFELDSLCYPLETAYLLWKKAGRSDWCTEEFARAAHRIIDVFVTEQHHEDRSAYRFFRPDVPSPDTLGRGGKGQLTEPCGLVWSGFRPSDDACELGYNIPGNAFIVVAMRYLAEIASDLLGDDHLAKRAEDLGAEVDAAISMHGKVAHPELGEVLAYEVDGRGNFTLMDDANTPSLLSLPLLGYCDQNDPLYLSTRRLILSDENPYFFSGIEPRSGQRFQGIGSQHTYAEYIWPIALAVEGLTTSDPASRLAILDQLLASHAGTHLMHESFLVTDPTQFSRPWFSWANAMFVEFALDLTRGDHRT